MSGPFAWLPGGLLEELGVALQAADGGEHHGNAGKAEGSGYGGGDLHGLQAGSGTHGPGEGAWRETQLGEGSV